MRKKSQEIAIIGAGLAGTFLAIELSRRGYRVNLFERSTREELVKDNSHRSYNLKLYGYALGCLKDIGILKDLKPSMVKIKGSVTHPGKNGQFYFSAIGSGVPCYSVSRASLLKVLIREAEKQKLISLNFGKILTAINKNERVFSILDIKTKQTRIYKNTVIFGADGVNSKVREIIQQERPADHMRISEKWNYKQIFFSRKTCKILKLKKHLTYTWTSENAVITGLPNRDGSFSAMLMLPDSETLGFNSLKDSESVTNLIRDNFKTLLPGKVDIVKSLNNNPIGNFQSIITRPWYFRNYLVVLGDAVHSMPPFYGQGVSAAFGDALEICRLIDANGNKWKLIFNLFQKRRRLNMDTLGELSRKNVNDFVKTRKADYKSFYEASEYFLYRMMPSVFAKPVFMAVTENPGSAYSAYSRIMKQRKYLNLSGYGVLIRLITLVAETWESIKIINQGFKKTDKTFNPAITLTKI